MLQAPSKIASVALAAAIAASGTTAAAIFAEAGIDPHVGQRKLRHGGWSIDEIASLATVLRVGLRVLIPDAALPANPAKDVSDLVRSG